VRSQEKIVKKCKNLCFVIDKIKSYVYGARFNYKKIGEN